MVRIQNVEKAKYIENNIRTYEKNRVGQYSKYLEKNPLFATYYHIAAPLSRTDVGTGGIEHELGPRSPIRYNKIVDFPIYNIPELKPDIQYDETGYDVELDLSDIVILPGTIKPSPGDYFIIKLPHSKEYLFRVNDFRYNTIQSNDFYSLSCDIKDIGIDIEDRRIKTQIVDEYQTVFDNIGTEDRCFVKTSDLNYLNSIADLYMKLREYYMNAFYKRDLNTFTIQIGYDCSSNSSWLYDPYLEKFINASGIYYDEGSDHALVLSLNSFKPQNFDLDYSRTLYDALIRNSIEMLCAYPYAYLISNKDRFSTFAHYGYHAMVPNLMMAKSSKTSVLTGSEGNLTEGNITIIKHGDPSDPDYKTKIEGINVDNVDVSQSTATYEIPWYSILGTPKWLPTWTCTAQYMSHHFIEQILAGTIETDDYCELIIFNYLHGISMEYDRKLIIDELGETLHNYYYLPMVIFILGQLYQNYFKKDRAFEL